MRRLVEAPLARFRRGGRPALLWAGRLTAASVASYLVADALFTGPEPLLAPLTALLVVQLTPVSLLASGLDRVLSVVAGVSVAALFSTAVQLSWWSLGIVIALSLLIGLALRLGANLVEVPISAMLVLGVGSLAADTAAWQRLSETLVGAAVGVVSNLLWPPRVQARDAGAAIEHLADDFSALLHRAGDEMTARVEAGEDLADPASGWLAEARRLHHEIPNAGTALIRAEESRRLNLRAAGTVDPGPGLRHGLESVEHSAVAVRSMFRSLHDAVRAGGESMDEPEVAGAVALTLHELADALGAFGRLVRDEAQPERTRQVEEEPLRQALEGLSEARARVSEMLLVDDDQIRTELNFALLAAINRVLTELDLDGHLRHQARAQASTLRRLVPRRPVVSGRAGRPRRAGRRTARTSPPP